MKKVLILILIIAYLPLAKAQTNIPVLNGDIENSTAMAQNTSNDKRWGISGFKINDNAPDVFQPSASGLAAGEGVNGTQALKITVANTTGASSSSSLVVNAIDISKSGKGTYTLKFYVKSKNQPKGRPFWIDPIALNSDGKATKEGIEIIDNGGSQLEGMDNDFIAQSVTIKVNNDAVKELRFQIQHGKFDNTYWFDNFTLSYKPL